MTKKKAFRIFIMIVIMILAVLSIYEWQSKKDSGDRQVVAFGDSLTYGYGDEKGEGYIDTLEKKLNLKHKKEYVFTNEAIYGLESSGVLEQLSDIRISSKLDEADYFIVFIGTNDLLNSNGGDLEKINRSAIDKGREVYVQNLKAILQNLKESNEETPILLLGLYNPFPDSREIEVIIDDWNKEIIRLAKKDERITYIQTNDLFKGKGKNGYFSDSLHLNSKGYKLIANRVLEKYEFN